MMVTLAKNNQQLEIEVTASDTYFRIAIYHVTENILY